MRFLNGSQQSILHASEEAYVRFLGILSLAIAEKGQGEPPERGDHIHRRKKVKRDGEGDKTERDQGRAGGKAGADRRVMFLPD